MKYTNACWIVVLAFVACWPSLSFGAIPPSINYQGRLTNAEGAPVNDTVDLVFDICADSLCSRPLWEESQTGVIVTGGLFSVLLGSITPIPPSVFSGSGRWLSISKDGVTAGRRLQMVSVPYAYRTLLADTAYYAKSVAGTDCFDCDVVFVNAVGPDSVISTSGTALLGKASGSSASVLSGIQGYSSNSSSGSANGGYFATSDSGTGVHFGVRAEVASSSPASPVYGVLGNANHSSSGDAYGGSFSANYGGSGTHYGVYAQGLGASNQAYGIYGVGANNSGGNAYGGFFSALSGGTGVHYGLWAESHGASGVSSYGTYGLAENTSSGNAYGGWFQTSGSGTGLHYGIRTESYGSSSASTYGVMGWASNSSSGNAYGGDFSTTTGGTGLHYGVRGRGYGSTDSSTYGVYGYSYNSSTGDAYGGYFETSTSGTGIHYGLRANALGSSPLAVTAVSAYAKTTTAGIATAGEFFVDQPGNGPHTGVKVFSSAESTWPTYGIDCTAYNQSSADVFSGYFDTYNLGTGWKYSVYATGPSHGYAGYFSGALVATGLKSAAVKVDNGEYRLLYAMESPETWFEDVGGGSLQNGVATVQIDPLYAQTANTQIEYRVFLTPEGDCRGLYVVNKTASSFEVRELQGGASNISFSYRIVAKRKGYEDVRMAKMLGPTPEQIEAKHAERQAEMEKEHQRMRQERPPAEVEPVQQEGR